MYRKVDKMKTNENGITLLSLVITVIVLAFLASVLINFSLRGNDTIDVMQDAQDSYYDQKEYTQNRIEDMANGWEDILD